ncbi:Chloride channel protein [Quillaja saponaria]|uniref:Chloride channel protein n=1 Tax=Quillaja saponaria TaxID=32244 RepID=A0AAD7LZ73_QUISA|nr:Chloride channel protein [Quillaja saponaria]
MGGLECVLGFLPSWQHPMILASFHHKPKKLISSSSSFRNLLLLSSLSRFTNKNHVNNYWRVSSTTITYARFSEHRIGLRLRTPFALPESGHDCKEEEEEEEEEQRQGVEQPQPPPGPQLLRGRGSLGHSGIIPSCLVGLLTGAAVVLFNYVVHQVRDFSWDGFPERGASWLREEPFQAIWTRVILVPASGGVIVSMLNLLHQRSASAADQDSLPPLSAYLNSALRPFLKTAAACVTLGTGNSLGPEGPSVEIGTSIAKGISTLFDRSSSRKLSLVAAGSAAGLSSGFNAAVAGCFFAVESVLWPSPTDSSLSLTNTTSMVILSAVIASVVSEVGLGSEPAFKVPEYDFRSPSELPLYLLLGILCGLISLALSWCTSYMLMISDNLHTATGIPRALFPVFGGLSIGLIALAYPEILYWGFENVDILLESRPFVKGLSTDLLLQLIAVKIVATSLCRASGLVGGYYAPSLFIGAATGMAYGKLIGFLVTESNFIIHLSVLEVASPQAYGLVGMAATLAGVCQVPLTAVLLLFELTQDYRIVLPLLGAVGLSSWITSGQTRRRDVYESNKPKQRSLVSTQQSETSRHNPSFGASSRYAPAENAYYASNLCDLESSLCIGDNNVEADNLGKRAFVSEAMRTRYVTVLMSSLLTEVVSLMLAEKQSCAMIVDEDDTLIGLLTLGDIQEYGKIAKAKSKRPKELLVSELCFLDEEICQVPWTATPDMDLLSAQMTMKNHGLSQVPVVKEHFERAPLVGILDNESISLTCRALATRESLS